MLQACFPWLCLELFTEFDFELFVFASDQSRQKKSAKSNRKTVPPGRPIDRAYFSMVCVHKVWKCLFVREIWADLWFRLTFAKITDRLIVSQRRGRSTCFNAPKSSVGSQEFMVWRHTLWCFVLKLVRCEIDQFCYDVNTGFHPIPVFLEP